MYIINSAGIAYHQNEVLYIIIAKRNATCGWWYTPSVMRCTLARDDIPLLSQWIKNRQVETCRFLVEMARFELASEDPFPKLSTSVVYLFSFLTWIADKQAKLMSSPLNPYKLQGSRLCRFTAKMTPLTESRYFQSGWAAIKQQLKLFYYCQLFLSCDFYSGATPLLAYLGSKSPSKSFHPHIFASLKLRMKN